MNANNKVFIGVSFPGFKFWTTSRTIDTHGRFVKLDVAEALSANALVMRTRHSSRDTAASSVRCGGMSNAKASSSTIPGHG